jgi:hypothetical protein
MQDDGKYAVTTLGGRKVLETSKVSPTQYLIEKALVISVWC